MKLALSRKNVWEKLPRPLKSGVGRLLGVVPPQYVFGRRFRRIRAWLAATEQWSTEQICAYQVEQLRRICALAAERSPFYQRWFASCGFDPRDLRGLEDLSRLPTIDKSTVRENLDELLTRPRGSSGVDETSTGGSGGAPLHFCIDAGRSAIEYAYLTTSWQRAGYRLGTPLAVLRGRVVAPNGDGVRHEFDPLLRSHYFSNFHTTDADFAVYLAQIERIGACFLHVYPSSAAALARYLQRQGKRAPDGIRGLLAESEIIYPEQRRLIEETFGQRVFGCYGHTEKLVLAAECEHSNDYHVWPTYGYFELLDEHGRAVTTPGQRGEIVGTGFINTVVPFIRYRTGDFATYIGEGCAACGRKHRLIRDILGHRVQEVLVAADGSEVSWTALNMHDDTFAHVRQFQFYQDTPGRSVLRIVPAAEFDDEDRERIRRNLGRKLDGRLEFEIAMTDAIPLSRRGKAIYVDQRLAGTAGPGDA